MQGLFGINTQVTASQLINIKCKNVKYLYPLKFVFAFFAEGAERSKLCKE